MPFSSLVTFLETETGSTTYGAAVIVGVITSTAIEGVVDDPVVEGEVEDTTPPTTRTW